MGRKLDLSGLSENEAEHVLQVVQRDMKLRKKEEQRLSELKQELDEEGSRCLLLSRRSCFNQSCCIRCCSPFTFLLNPKRRCHDCHYNVCKACRVHNKQDKAWLCSACQKSRLLQTQSLEWFYTDVKTRFKRFGSAKVLKTLYRKHLVQHSALSELTESSTYEDSVSGSDSTFYRQTQEHSIAETITVALRVAEEAIDEAISKAEFDTTSQEKQHEADYLREHRGELIEELSKTIVQKIISRRKTLTEMRAAEYDQDWPLEHNTDLQQHHQSDCDQASSSIQHQPHLWGSQAAFSLLDHEPPGLRQDSSQALKKDGAGSAMSSRKTVERLDNTGVYGGVSSVMKSPDGNWMALQSSQLSRPSLLTRRKSLVFSVLERESEVVSAYEGMDSDHEPKPEGGARVRTPSPLTGSRGDLFSQPEGDWKPKKPPLARVKRKVPTEAGRPSSSCRTNIIDVNFNVEGAEKEEGKRQAAKTEIGKVRRTRKKRRNKRELSSSVLEYWEKNNHSRRASDALTPLTSGAATPELFHRDPTGHQANRMEEQLTLKLQQLAGRVSDSLTGGGGGDEDGQRGGKRQGRKPRGEDDERPWRMEIDLNEGRTEEDEEMKDRFYRLIAQSRLTYLSTDEDLDKDGHSEGDEEGDMEAEKTARLTSKLCQLENEVRANQFSSTEDELDRVGVMDEDSKTEEEEEEEELAVKVCRLANQANATQFSSTEEELDRAGGGEEGEEAIEEENLWKRQTGSEDQASQLHDVTRLISASQFSSMEDELDRVGEKEVEEETHEGGVEREEGAGNNVDRREPFGGLDVNLFDLRDEIKTESCDEEVEDVQQEKTESEGKKDCVKARETDEDERMGKGHRRQEKELLKEDMEKKENERRRAKELISSDERKAQRGNQPEKKCQKKPERGEEQEEGKSTGGEESQDTTDSDEEDAEFERIISSMLTMTLEDMQMEALKDVAADNGRSTSRGPEEEEAGEEVKIERDGGFEETGRTKEESAVREGPVDIIRETGGGGGGDAAGRDEDERQEKDEGIHVDIKEPDQAKQTYERQGMDEEEREDRNVPDEVTGEGGAYESKERSERLEEEADDEERSASPPQGASLSPEEIKNRLSAVSLRSITTEVLKVLNAAEELLLQGEEGGAGPRPPNTSLPPNTDPQKLDHQFSRLEENVYVAAGDAYGLEAELSDLEECSRAICSTTSDLELSFLEEQVASAAAKVQQSELQVSNISDRIAALKSAGLKPVTVESSRQLRRRLPAPPLKDGGG
ncbi:Rab effector MyRIP [Liparis tanakae]|uniref:Rab effector MyRIP n=1 Tax=Liparis tanakae TaxID=230148 RepID=A0A4Z2GQD9_9TELE|nr:Rab effector MyRIP [Liparis tanakae]